MILIGASVAYYLVFYLPSRDTAKVANEEQTQQARENRYNDCLNNARKGLSRAWISRCKANNITITKDENSDETCLLTDTMSKSVEDDYKAEKDVCLQMYKVQ